MGSAGSIKRNAPSSSGRLQGPSSPKGKQAEPEKKAKGPSSKAGDYFRDTFEEGKKADAKRKPDGPDKNGSKQKGQGSKGPGYSVESNKTGPGELPNDPRGDPVPQGTAGGPMTAIAR